MVLEASTSAGERETQAERETKTERGREESDPSLADGSASASAAEASAAASKKRAAPPSDSAVADVEQAAPPPKRPATGSSDVPEAQTPSDSAVPDERQAQRDGETGAGDPGEKNAAGADEGEAEEEWLTTGSEWLGKRVARTSPRPPRSMSLCGLSLAYLTAHLAVILLQSSAWAVTNDCQCLDPAALNASSYPATHLPANAYHLFILPYAK